MLFYILNSYYIHYILISQQFTKLSLSYVKIVYDAVIKIKKNEKRHQDPYNFRISCLDLVHGHLSAR